MTRTVRIALTPGDGTGTGALDAALRAPAEPSVHTGDLGGPATTAGSPRGDLARGGARSTI